MLGIVQLSRINEIVAKRPRGGHVPEATRGDKRLTVPREPADSIMSWFVYVIRLADRYSLSQRNDILSRMLQRGVQVSNYFPPVYLQPFMAKELGHKEGDLPITDAVCRSTIALPFHNNLTEDEVDFVCEQLAACLAETD